MTKGVLSFFMCLMVFTVNAVAETNAADTCTNKQGVLLAVEACDFGDIIQLPGVDFSTGSAQLTSRAAGLLDRLVTVLEKNQSLRFEIAGHTDNVGTETNNRRLSKRRASAVMTYLVLKGVASDRLMAQGYGESSPISDNRSAEGRKQNRRVELRVVAVDPEG